MGWDACGLARSREPLVALAHVRRYARGVQDRLIAALADRGLDLAAPLAVEDHDAAAPALAIAPGLWGRARTLGIVVGNTRALWPHLPPLVGEHPLDAYVERAVADAIDAARPGAAWTVRWAHHVPATVAIQRAAEVAGLAYLAPSHLCVHPVYGPWIALRALIAFDLDGPPVPAPRIAPPCDCAAGCGDALARALAAGAPTSTAELRERWRLWLAVRDACPAGRAHRYDDAQIRFHYAGER